MKRLPDRIVSRGALAALVAAPLVVAALWAPPASAVVAPAGPALAEVDDPLTLDRLKDEVRKRDAVGDAAGVAALLKANPEGSVVWVINTNEDFAARPDEKLGKEMKLLRAGWRRAFDSDFFDNTEKFLALLRPELKRERDRLRQGYNQLYLGPYPEVVKDQQQSSSRTLKAAALSQEFETLAKAFREIGDLYHASQAHMHAGYLVDSTVVQADADFARALAQLKAALEARNQLGLNDRWATNLVIDIDRLETRVTPPEPPTGEGEGEGEGEDGGVVAGTPSEKLPGVSLGPVATSEGVFEVVPEVGAYERLGYAADDIMMLWIQVWMGAEGTSARVPTMPNDGPLFTRTAASAAEITGADGQKTSIPLTGRAELVTTTVGTAEAPRPWAVLVQVPSDKEQYQGFEVNYAPTLTQLGLGLAPAGGMRHQVGGVSVLVLDDNLDGLYGGPYTSWSFDGVVEGSYQMDVDAIVVGKSKRAVPFSELANIEGKWYRLESADGGTRLLAQPASLHTGKVTLEAKGIDPYSVIVRGVGPLEHCWFDLAATSGPVELPAGSYQLAQGTIREGKRMQIQKALFLGAATSTFTVPPRGTVKFEIGAPFDVEATVAADDTKVKLTGKSLVVTGKSGERYMRLWGYPLEPEIALRKPGAKRAEKPVAVPVVKDQDTINQKGLTIAWFPLDLELEHDLGSGGVEVQFTQKKHPLFGNLASTWR